VSILLVSFFAYWLRRRDCQRVQYTHQDKKRNTNIQKTHKKFFTQCTRTSAKKILTLASVALASVALASVALASVALASVAHYCNAMVTTNAPRATTQLTLQRFALTAVEEKWSASRLAREADCNVHTAEKFLSRLADTGMEKTQREVLTLADSYRHTLERTAARSREYLESISHIELDQLDKEQRSLRKDALSSLSSLSSMLRLEITGDSSASAPPRLGNL
jgi:hypothetical protein